MAMRGKSSKKTQRQEADDTFVLSDAEDASGDGAEVEDQPRVTRSQTAVTQLMEMMMLQQQKVTEMMMLQQQKAEEREQQRWEEDR